MTLSQQLAEDLKGALKRRDETAKTALRMAMAALHNAEIAAGRPLDEVAAFAVLQREVRKRGESIEEFRKGKRPDLVAREEGERAVLQRYLPAQMSRPEVMVAARAVIAEVGASSLRDRGRVMGLLVPRLAGRAEGRLVSEVVAELLTGEG